MTDLDEAMDLMMNDGDVHWKERLPFMTTDSDFNDQELTEISSEAAMDLLTSSQLRTLVILLAGRMQRAEILLKSLRDIEEYER